MKDFQMTAAAADIELLETRLAARITAAIAPSAEQVSPDVAERLRFAREQALSRARAARSAPALVGAGGVGVLGARGVWWARLTVLLPAVALIAGLLAISHWNARERSLAAAEIDTALLSDQLPPAAYADPGFVAFLKLAQP